MKKLLKCQIIILSILFSVLGSHLVLYTRASPKILELDLLYHPRGQNDLIAQIIRRNLLDVGIKVNLQPELLGNYINRLLNGDFDLLVALETFPFYSDTDSILYPLHSYDSAIAGTPYYTIYRNPSVDALIMEARNKSHEIYEGNRAMIFMNAMWLNHKDVPYIPLIAPLSFIISVDELQNVKYCCMGYHYNVYANVTHPTENQLKIGQGLDISTLDPAEATETQEWHVIRQIYDGLINVPWNFTSRDINVYPPPDIPPITPALATNYSCTPDFRTWRFSLRKNVTFHDGTPFNASAVAFTFNRILNWANSSSEYYQNQWIPKQCPYGDLFLKPLNLRVSWNESDPYSVTLFLDEPMSVFNRTLSLLTFGIVSPTYVKNHNSSIDPSRLTFNPIGTGPFKFLDYSPGETITLERNLDYWGLITGSSERLIFKTISDSNVALSELLSGSIHLIDELLYHYPDHEFIKSNEDIKSVPLTGIGYKVLHLMINSHRFPFNNTTEITELYNPEFGLFTTHGALLRRALAYGINRTMLQEEVYYGNAIIPNSCLDAVEDYSGHNSTFSPYPYAPSTVIHILDDLGYSTENNNRNLRIDLEPIVIFLVILIILLVSTQYRKIRKS